VSDHGAFVLFNLYVPAISSEEKAEERMEYKMAFCRALEKRLRQLVDSGRQVWERRASSSTLCI
jgi:AP endonuclease-2